MRIGLIDVDVADERLVCSSNQVINANAVEIRKRD